MLKAHTQFYYIGNLFCGCIAIVYITSDFEMAFYFCWFGIFLISLMVFLPVYLRLQAL
jgi:hypothetical protein